MKKYFSAETYQEIYLDILKELHDNPDFKLSNTNEGIGITFELKNITKNHITGIVAEKRKFSLDYAEAFKDYVLFSHISDKYKEKLLEVNKDIETWLGEFEGRNTQYNPRIAYQLEHVIRELKVENSRRAFMTILEKEDHLIGEAKQDGKTNIEVPCTLGAVFNIRDGKLYLCTYMRSQDWFKVSNWDIYIWTSALMYVADELGVEYGTLTHSMASCHYYTRDNERVEELLKLK